MSFRMAEMVPTGTYERKSARDNVALALDPKRPTDFVPYTCCFLPQTPSGAILCGRSRRMLMKAIALCTFVSLVGLVTATACSSAASQGAPTEVSGQYTATIVGPLSDITFSDAT